MWPIATEKKCSLWVCLSAGHSCEPYKNRIHWSRCRLVYGIRWEHALARGLDPPGEGAIIEYLPAHCEEQGISSMSQSYSVHDSSNVAFRSQYTAATCLLFRSEVQTCIWPSWCHCHSLSLSWVKSRLVLTFWYWLTRVLTYLQIKTLEHTQIHAPST